MANELQGVRVAFLAADGVEQVELERSWKALDEAGANLELLSLKAGKIQALNHLDKGDRFDVDRKVADADAGEYDALVVPGGVANPDFLRADEDAVRFVRAIFDQGKPIAAICHGPWVLVEAGIVAGRTLTSWPSLKTDIRNAGGSWVDAEVHVDGQIVTSRKPADLPAFTARTIELFSRPQAAGALGASATREGGVARRQRPRDEVEEASMESFPASDAPPGPSAV